MSTDAAGPAYEVATSYEIPQKSFYSIEYPGYVRPASVPRAITRLGGEKRVSEAFRKNLNVDLKLHDPGTRPFAHPPSGKTVEVQNLVLKVTRRKRKVVVPKREPENSGNDVEMQGSDTIGEQHPPAPGWEGMPFANALREATTSKGEFKIEVLGRLQKTVRFRTPADFQYEPPVDDPVVKLRAAMGRLDYKAILDYRMPTGDDSGPFTAQEQTERGLAASSNLRIMPPPLWTQYNYPLQYRFKQNPQSTPQTIIDKHTGQGVTRMINKGRMPSVAPASAKFGDPIPMGPPEGRVERLSIVKPEVVARVRELFEQRPVWTRVALLSQLTVEEVRAVNNTKNVIPLCSYTFDTGPWKDTYIRFGYDPKANAEAATYQVLSLRLNPGSGSRPSVIAPNKDASGGMVHKHLQMHIFDGQTLPTGTCTFQLCDITDPLIRSYIDDPVHRIEDVHERNGWFDHVTMERIRHLLKRKLIRLVERGVPCTDKDCEDLLIPDDAFAKLISGSWGRRTGGGAVRTRVRHKAARTDEESAAKRLEKAVQQRG